MFKRSWHWPCGWHERSLEKMVNTKQGEEGKGQIIWAFGLTVHRIQSYTETILNPWSVGLELGVVDLPGSGSSQPLSKEPGWSSFPGARAQGLPCGKHRLLGSFLGCSKAQPRETRLQWLEKPEGPLMGSGESQESIFHTKPTEPGCMGACPQVWVLCSVPSP